MNDIKQIIEEPDGIVLLRFRSFREPTNLSGTSASRKNFLISTQIEASLPKNHKIIDSGHPHQNQLSMILHLLLPQE